MKNINKKLSIGIVGCGRISSKHLSAINSLYLKSKLQLKCVCDSDIKKAKLVSIKYRVPAYRNMYEMAKNEKLDIISILTESGNHPTHFVNLAKYAKIFVIEKPLALKTKDVFKVIKIAKKYKNKIFVVKQNRFNPAIQQLKNAIKNNRFGKKFLATARVRWSRSDKYYKLAPWRGKEFMDGGVIGNQASHHIDMLIWLMGKIRKVNAAGIKAIAKIESFDTVIANLKFASGALGIVEATTATRPKDLEGSISILGDKGSAVIGGFSMNLVEKWNFSKNLKKDKNIFKFSTKPKTIYGDGHASFYLSLIKSLASKETLHPKNSLHTVEVIEAINKSAKQNKTIYIK